MNPGWNPQPSPNHDACVFAAPVAPSTDAESYPNDTGGTNPPATGTGVIGYDQEKFAADPPKNHSDDARRSVFEKSPVSGDDDPAINANTVADPTADPDDVPDPAADAADADAASVTVTSPRNTPATRSFECRTAVGVGSHTCPGGTATVGSTAHNGTCTNCNRESQSPP
jgi:hypothetical protein